MHRSKASTGEKLKLGENHRRVISVVLRGLEQMCEEIERWLDKRSGVLLHVENDLTAEQRVQLCTLVKQLRGEIERLATEIELDRGAQSLVRAIRALLSASIVDLEESDSSRLKGYGNLSEVAKNKLDTEILRLTGLLEEMVDVVESHGATLPPKIGR